MHILDGSGTSVPILDGDGNEVQLIEPDSGLFGLGLTPDGQSVWVASFAGNLYRIHLATGALTLGPVSVLEQLGEDPARFCSGGPNCALVFGMCLNEGYVAATTPPDQCVELDENGTPVIPTNHIACGSVEFCFNDVDDDGDGLVDLAARGRRGYS